MCWNSRVLSQDTCSQTCRELQTLLGGFQVNKVTKDMCVQMCLRACAHTQEKSGPLKSNKLSLRESPNPKQQAQE